MDDSGGIGHGQQNAGAADSAAAAGTPPPCPMCGGRQYRREEGKLDSQWGFTAHGVTIIICQQCGYVLLFSRGRSMFDFD